MDGSVRVRERVFLNTEFTESAEGETGQVWRGGRWTWFCERNIGNGSREYYQLSIDLFVYWVPIQMRRGGFEREWWKLGGVEGVGGIETDL